MLFFKVKLIHIGKKKPKNDNYDLYLKTIYNGFLKNIKFSFVNRRKKISRSNKKSF